MLPARVDTFVDSCHMKESLCCFSTYSHSMEPPIRIATINLLNHFDFVLIILQPSPLYIISAGWLANVHMLLKGLPVKHIHH